jgi:formylglycine-generating enzyme required for sulfatase activity
LACVPRKQQGDGSVASDALTSGADGRGAEPSDLEFGEARDGSASDGGMTDSSPSPDFKTVVVPIPLSLTWVSIPAGSFEMGCTVGDSGCLDEERENPRRTVDVSAFEMLSTEVTQLQFLAVMGFNPSSYVPGADSDDCTYDCPVDTVSWHHAVEFCERVRGRLPSEAEWEYAARAGSPYIFVCGDSFECLDEFAWHSARGFGPDDHQQPVATKMPNDFGLYDMIGNVWEWVADCWHGSFDGAPESGIIWAGGNCDVRVIRGNSRTDFGLFPRVSQRYYMSMTGGGTTGFRCARAAVD